MLIFLAIIMNFFYFILFISTVQLNSYLNLYRKENGKILFICYLNGHKNKLDIQVNFRIMYNHAYFMGFIDFNMENLGIFIVMLVH